MSVAFRSPRGGSTADTILTETQKEILQLLADNEKGLTRKEIYKEAETLGISAEEVGDSLSEFAFLRLVRLQESDLWLITHEGLTAIGAVENPPWP